MNEITATQAEILARFQECRARHGDFDFGFETDMYFERLDFEHVKPFLKKGVTAEEWGPVPTPPTREALLTMILEYMPFAFEKANNMRGISANRSVAHMIAWTWLAGEREFSAEIQQEYETNYQHYGKEILRKICERFGWDWKQWDDGALTNGED